MNLRHDSFIIKSIYHSMLQILFLSLHFHPNLIQAIMEQIWIKKIIFQQASKFITLDLHQMIV